MERYTLIFNAISSGINGPGLGSDEAEIVCLIFMLVDTQQNEVNITISQF